MDDDDLRRGQPSCHKKYGEATAILVGDLLQALSFELLATVGAPAIQYFARAVGGQGMVSGQFLDMTPNNTSSLRLHRLKTGKLIEASVVLSFIVSQGKLNLVIMRWARDLGLLFQITDDLLDATQNSDTLGKTAGKDAAQQKKTVIAVLGMEAAVKHAQDLAAKLKANAVRVFPESAMFAALPEYLLSRRS
jgi:farnesyl diphosphate synthase